MSLLSIKLHWAGTTGGRKLWQSTEYTAIWFVTMSSKLDQAQTLLNAFEAHVDGAARGDVYAFAADTATGPAYLRSLTATRKQDSQVHWEVQATYTSDQEATQGRDIDGVPTDDPLDFAPIFRVSNVQYQKPLDTAQYISGLKVGGAAELILLPGAFVVPVNSAMVPFDDPIMVDDSHCVLEIERNFTSYDGADDELYQNAVNTNCIRFVKKIWKATLTSGAISYIQTGLYIKDISALCAKIREIKTSFDMINEIEFIRVAYIIDIDPNTWRFPVIDKGTLVSARIGDPTGDGGTVALFDSHQNPLPAIPAGIPDIRRLTDWEGRPIPDPVLFDGDGQPLDITVPGWTPVKLIYKGYTELDFLTIPFFTGISSSCEGTATG